MGGIIYVSGFYGAGKTTLIRAALDRLVHLNYLVTYTTRAPRPGELLEQSHEYQFVSLEKYSTLRQASTAWDHTEVAGYFYGADTEAINKAIQEGQWYIVAVMNDLETLRDMQRWYQGERFVIWIDTPLETCRQRVRMRDGELAAQKKISDPTQTEAYVAKLRAFADTSFQPTGELARDSDTFIELIKQKTGC